MNTSHKIIGSVLLVATLAGSLSGCAGMKSAPRQNGETSTIWQSREQYVAVVPQEQAEGAPVNPNRHPLTIAPAELRRLLSTVLLVNDSQSPQQLFTENELQIVSDTASAGLAQAGPLEEVTFVMYGFHPTLLGLAKEQRVTSGRIFYQQGELNLILGNAQREVNDREDRRLFPILPGSRRKPAVLAGHIVPAKDKNVFSLKRHDWLVFPIKPNAPAPAAMEPASSTPVIGSTHAGTTAETGEKNRKGIEERLLLLKSLKEKNLITDEEYRGKRQQLLNEL